MNTYVKAFIALVLAFVFTHPVKAQSLTPLGMWEDYQPYTRERDPDWQTTMVVPKINPGAKVPVTPEKPDVVSFPNQETPGTVIIYTNAKKLVYVLDGESALAYPIAVGRDSFQWTGTEKVSRIEEWPAWIPPKEMRLRQPTLPVRMEGGLNNPLGAVAIYLGGTLYRIHGSNDPKSIGTESSSGCFRMHNEHAVHLASLVRVGTVVKVTK